MVWGSSAGLSCDQLLERIERNDPTLKELVVLPLKKFGPSELGRIATCILDGRNTHLTTLQASGHCLNTTTATTTTSSGGGDDDDDDENKNGIQKIEKFGSAISSRGLSNRLVNISIGDSTFGDDGVVAFCRGLATATVSAGVDSSPIDNGIHIEKLDLSYKGIGRVGLVSLLDVMGRQTCLQHLDLSRNDLLFEMDLHSWMESTYGDHVTSRPCLFPQVSYLDLSCCGLDSRSCLGWLVALHGGEKQSRANSDVVIKLNGNDMGGRNNDDDGDQSQSNFESFVNHFAYKSSRYVQQLHMSKCNLGDEEMKVLSKCWFSTVEAAGTNNGQQSIDCQTQELVLDQNNFTSTGLSLWADNMLQQINVFNDCDRSMTTMLFQRLQKLNLSGNQFNDESCLKLATVISESKKEGSCPFSELQELDLSKTNCGVNASVKLIGECQLTNLNLFGNRLGSDSFLTMSKVLTGGHTSLVTLDVGGNDASEAGVVALLQALLSSRPSDKDVTESTLRLLVVGGNKSGPTVESLVQEIKRIHPDLDIARDKPRKNQAGQ